MATIEDMRQKAKLNRRLSKRITDQVHLGIMPVGKYKGRRIIHVVTEHPRYCDRLIIRLNGACHWAKALKQMIILFRGEQRALRGVDSEEGNP